MEQIDSKGFGDSDVEGSDSETEEDLDRVVSKDEEVKVKKVKEVIEESKEVETTTITTVKSTTSCEKNLSQDSEDELEPGQLPLEEQPEDSMTQAEKIQLLESFLELTDAQINWKMFDVLFKDNVWIKELDKINYDEVIPPTKPLQSEEDSDIKPAKLSFGLMRLLSNEQAPEKVKTFLTEKCHEIALHALAVFHPLSTGNAYHGRSVLELLLRQCPKVFISKLANEKDLQYIYNIFVVFFFFRYVNWDFEITITIHHSTSEKCI
ncbi:hypothetical protein RFI_30473, partial [Reticulomyxa filosa]